MADAGTAARTSAPSAPLDEVMLAMDVVDTLRHQQDLVAQELARPETDEELIERLRRVYESQGIEVSDRILREGVEALRENRFTYRPPARIPLWMRLYIRRGAVARGLLLVLVIAALVIAAYQFLVVAPRQALGENIRSTHAAIVAVAQEDEAVALGDALFERAQAAHAAGDSAEASALLEQMEELQETLELSYQLVITSGQEIGIWRTPDLNPNLRNYYLIVEPVDSQGNLVSLPIRNEETGRTERVSEFGLGVTEATWESVAADLEDDGIIQDEVVGAKERGVTEPEYFVETTGGAITQW